MSADDLRLGRYLLDDDTARWVRRGVTHLAAGRDVPTFGSPEWQDADRGLQVAGALLAAEAHRRDTLFLADALEDELTARRQWQDRADAVAFAELAGRVVAFDHIARTAAALAKGPTHAELVERRAS